MLRITDRVISAALKEDTTVTSEQRQMAMAILRGKLEQPKVIDSRLGKQRLLVTQAEAAELLAVSRWQIRRLVQDGRLHPVVLGRGGDNSRARRYRWDELRAIAGGEAG